MKQDAASIYRLLAGEEDLPCTGRLEASLRHAPRACSGPPQSVPSPERPLSSHGLQWGGTRRESGAILIIALGVLTLMAILGATFATLILLEKKATDNYIDARRMDLLLDSAVDRVVAMLQGGKNLRHFTNSLYRDNPWLSVLRNRAGQVTGELSNGRAGLEDDRVGAWEVFTRRAGQVYDFKNKIIDCAAQINLNGRQDTLARMLDNLGLAIEKSENLKRDGRQTTNPFYEKPNRQGNQLRGEMIVQYRRRMPEGRFTSKTQIRELIGPENFEIVKDFVTVHSWEDPYTYKASDGLDEVQILGSGGTTSVGGGRGLGGGGGGRAQPEAHGVPRLDPEPRCPININTAPEEVLIACIQGLAGRRVFPFSRLGSLGQFRSVNEGAQIQGERLTGVEEYRDITPRAVFVYTQQIQYEQAQKLAQRITSQRREKPFMAWRTNDPSKPGFEDFVDGLSSDFFPSPQTCQVIDPDQPQNREVEGVILRNGSQEVARMWTKGTGPSNTRGIRIQKGLMFHDQNGWYYELVKGVLKANFNPNSRINRYNPNSPAYLAVDKSDLVWAKDRFNIHKGHTTEFTFDANGIYEVTTLGRIAEQLKGQGRLTAVQADKGEQVGRVAFEKQVRTVVQVYDVLRHTNQYHFERTFNTNSQSSKGNRKFVVTWPDPMAALTELVSSGSLRDGRVELAGLLDGRRLEASVLQRTQLLRNWTQLTLAHTFQDRVELRNLQRVVTQGTRNPLGDPFTEAVREVLDPPYTRASRAQFGKYVSRSDLVQLGGSKNISAQFYDPLVNREQLGTDLRPDGLHCSLLTMTHLQARTLLLPARSRIGSPGVGGDGDPRVGASGRGSRGNNALGNVPYYKGGIAFWVKFDFDGDDPVFSGLLGCTQVIKPVMPNAGDYTGSEGTQFFIFKNMKGQLRVVRMYYHQAFPEEGGEGGGDAGGDGTGIRLFPSTGSETGGVTSEQNPIVPELDQQKLVSRVDTTPVDVSHFKAHEWHHIAIDWDDENPVFPVRLYVDFQDLKDLAQPRMAQKQVDSTANSWVRLNERQPRDGLQIGGIIRDQGVEDSGVFKWFTNTTKLTTGGQGIETVARSVKRILANATIDEFICHDSQFAAVKQYYGGQGAPGYFTNQRGEYANLFEIPCPPDLDHVILRSFDWTSYYPATYTDSKPGSIPQPLAVTPIRCDLTYNSGSGSPPSSFDEPWKRPSVENAVGGRAAYRRETGVRGNNIQFVYNFKFSGSRSAFGNTSGGIVQTPVIDDVTLTYFLPSPRILIQEEAD